MFRAGLALAAAVALYAGVAIGSSDGVRSTPAHTVATGPHLARLLALTGGLDDGALVRLDRRTLRPEPVGSGGCASEDGGTACWSPAWAVSPDGTRLVLAESVSRGLRDRTSLRIVDPTRMRTTARVAVPGGPIGGLAWLRPDRVLAVQELPGERQHVVAIDLPRRRVVARHPLGGAVIRLAVTRHALTLLVAPARTIG
jgi:hypothetical protein